MKLYKYTEQELRKACADNFSYHRVLCQLGVTPAGGNYATLKKAIKYFNIDISHFTGQGWNKGKKHGPKRSLDDYLSNKFPIKTYSLKRRLLAEGIFQHKCYNCNNEEWLGEPTPLELHHIDGNSKNNNLSNLQLLCPNCHSLTSNYRGRNKVRVVGVEPT